MRNASVPALPLVALAVALGGLGACEDRVPGESGTAAPTRVADAMKTAPAPPPSSMASVRRATPCRAIAVDGDVRSEGDAGAPVALSSGIALEPWVDLVAGARLVAKDPRTTRETTFRGPARVRACVDSIEESWVDMGVFESSVGAGESPGAEEWVVTPLGVVRFAAAKLGVQVSPHRFTRAPAPPKGGDAGAKTPAAPRETVRVNVAEGVAFVWASADVSERGAERHLEAGVDDEGWRRVSEGVEVLVPNAPASPLDRARAALGTCEAEARSARDLASALLSNDGGLARVAARQVATRRLARAACAVAALRVGALPADEDPAAKETAETSLHEALALSHELPR